MLILPRVEGEIVSGLKYLQVVKRTGVTVDKTEAMLGSYGPQQDDYTKIVSYSILRQSLYAVGTCWSGSSWPEAQAGRCSWSATCIC